MANLSNINDKFLVTTGGNVLIGQTSAIGSSMLQVTGNSTFAGNILFGTDGTYDIGSTSGSRPRNVVVSNSIAINTSTGAAGTLNVASTGTFGGKVQVNKAKSGTGVENYDLIRLNLTGTGAIGDSSTIAWHSTNGTKTAGIEGISGLDNIAYGELAFSTRRYTTDTYLEAMRINNRGNVGIGVTGPVTKLELPGSLTNSSLKVGTVETQSYSVNNAWIADNVYYDGSFKLRSNGHASQIYFGTSNGGADISFKRYPTGNAGDVVTGVTSLQLLGDGDVYIPGNVGIGTTLPQGKLDSVAPVADLTDFGRATGSALNIRIGNAVGYLGQINFCNTDAPAFGYGSIGMVMTSGSGVGLGDMVFGTKSSGSAVVSTERMRITSAGEIKAKPATSGRAFFSTQDPGNFSIAYTAYMVNASTKVLDILWYGSTIGSITVNSAGSGVDYNTTSSDERLKKNITNWDENILDKFKDIKPKEFHFHNQDDSEEKIKGYIAQNEVDKFPEAYPLVYNEEVKEDRHLFNPSGMVVYLMKAIQELKAEIELLKSK